MINSMGWHIWLIVYLVIGLVVVAFLWRYRASSKKTFANEVSKIIEAELDETKSPNRLFLEKTLMTGLALLFAWLFWPIMVLGRVWVALR